VAWPNRAAGMSYLAPGGLGGALGTYPTIDFSQGALVSDLRQRHVTRMPFDQGRDVAVGYRRGALEEESERASHGA
jgi:hypothetical protein